MTEHEILLTEVLQCRRVDLYVEPLPLTAPQQEHCDRLQERRRRGEPLQYILGYWDFMGLRFSVNPLVLIPRPETEILVEKVIDIARSLPSPRPLKILDLGTGSGNIAIALAKLIADSLITAIDVSPEAIAVAQSNALDHNVRDKIKFVCADMISFLQNPKPLAECFDIIVSNPPYIPTAQLEQLPLDVQHEPAAALDGGDDGLRFYRAIIAHGYRHLNPSGWVCFEIGDGQAPVLQNLLWQYPQYQNINVCPDYTQTDRIISVRKDTATWKN